MKTEPAAPAKTRRSRIRWAPYLLILPSLVYLALFFAWPMVRAIRLAVWDENAVLTVARESFCSERGGGHPAPGHADRRPRPRRAT